MLPKPPNGGDWHMLVVTAEAEDEDAEQEVTWYHPTSCGVSVCIPQRGEASQRYECVVQYQLDNAGLDGIFESGEPEPGIWLVTPWIEKIVGPDWTEWDSGWEVHSLQVQVD